MSPVDAHIVLSFWFDQAHQPYWFKQDDGFDQKLNALFFPTWQAATKGELFGWRATAQGRLAEIIVLDQFSRNFFRQDPRAFAQDLAALVLAQEAIASGADQQLSTDQRAFLYMPMMHSESLKVHQQAMPLFESLPNKEYGVFEKKHAEVIARFGRFPHRNEVLGRSSSTEEKAYLQENPRGF
jgi:uncharacterized protein (DUF924 family)